MKFGFKTDVGIKRTKNEDALLVLPKYGIFAVADGVGGRSGGEIASRKVVIGIEEFIKNNPISALEPKDGIGPKQKFEEYFSRCLEKINTDILNFAEKNPETSGMATTAVVAHFSGRGVSIANIGDSRAYLINTDEIKQLTEDHSYVNKLINSGTLSKDEALVHPDRNMITKALGATSQAESDFYNFELQKGDRILLCTDGLTGMVPDSLIHDIAISSDDLNFVCKGLVKAANDHGGDDNITVVLFEN
jgi:protein phosphatase